MKKESSVLIKIFIALTSVVIIVSVCVHFIFRNEDAHNEKIEYTVIIENLDEEFTDNLKKNDRIVSCVTKRSIGEISDIQIRQSEEEVFIKNTSEMRLVPLPKKYDVTISVLSDANTQNGFKAGGVELAVGDALYLFTKNLYFVGKIGEIYD